MLISVKFIFDYHPELNSTEDIESDCSLIELAKEINSRVTKTYGEGLSNSKQRAKIIDGQVTIFVS